MTALIWAEKWFLNLHGPVPETCTPTCKGLALHPDGGLPPQVESRPLSWWMEHGHEAGVDPLTGERLAVLAAGSTVKPIWIIEKLHAIPPAKNRTGHWLVWYRLLARGSGRTKNATSVVESTLVRSWSSNDAPGLDEVNADICPGSESSMTCGRVSWRELR